MLSFSEYITEASNKKEVSDGPKLSSNSKGVLHELLVGYHLRGGKHLEKHNDIDGLSPEQAHDKIVESIGGTKSSQYKEAFERARAASDHIKQTIGKDVKNVQWTSKAGDIKRATGIDASQDQDPSDIVVTDKDGRHHGVSLKVTDSNSEVPISNPGMESTHGGRVILEQHREALKKDYPNLSIMSKDERKNFMKTNVKASQDIRSRNTNVLKQVVGNLHAKLSTMEGPELEDHLRNFILHAHSTPLQDQGHSHIRHTTYGSSGKYTFKSMDPSKNYEHILKDHENIKVEHSGTSIIFTHKGIPFARHRMKFESQSDPLSVIKGSGEEIRAPKAKVEKATTEKKAKVAPKSKPAKVMSHDPIEHNATSQFAGINYHTDNEQTHIKGYQG